MNDRVPNTIRPGWRSTLWGYNLRILLGNTYWLVAAPVVAAQLVIFWSMAISSFSSASRAAQTIELLAAILGAFLCAHALAPEQDGVGELVFVRPLSLEKILLLRLAMVFGFVLVILIPAFVIYNIGIDGFPLGLTVLSALPSMLFLSALSMAVASATRHPLLGVTAAGAFWAVDFAAGGYFNPLVSLHRFGDHLANQPMSEQWIANKFILVALGGACYLWNRRLLGRPPAPRRWASMLRTGLVVALVAAAYVVTGAGYKVAYGLRHEREWGSTAALWYQQQFKGYGPLPVARIFGPAFQLYVQAAGTGPGRAGPGGAGGGAPISRGEEPSWGALQMASMREIVRRYPRSIWADNAQFEVALHGAPTGAVEPWLVLGCTASRPAEVKRRLVAEDLDYTRRELQALVDHYPHSPFAPTALSKIAEIGLQTLDFEGARRAYEQMIRGYPDAPEACEAGMGLAAAYMHERAPEKALKAADIAAKVAPWAVRGEALLAAAQAAQWLGKKEVARQRYQAAAAAAREALERLIRNEKAPVKIPKAELMQRCDTVVHTSEMALAAGVPDLPPPGPQVVLSSAEGRIVTRLGGLQGIRVAIGATPSPDGFPSPFREGPAYAVEADADGAFRFEQIPAGDYQVIAVALRTWEGEGNVGISLPSLGGEGRPITVSNRAGAGPLHLGDVVIEVNRPAPTPPSVRPGTGRGGRGGRSGRGGLRGRGRAPTSEEEAEGLSSSRRRGWR